MLDILFNKYIESLRLFSFSNEDGVGCIYQADIKKRIEKYKNGMNNLFAFISKGNLIKANREANKLFAITANRETAEVWFPTIKIQKGKYWFRSRKPDFEKVFKRRDLFHVPFELRGRIGANRFSIPGYPCLYLGATLECAREETGELAITAVSCFKNLKEIEVFDFSFFSPQSRKGDNLFKEVISYPFKIAALIPLTPKKDSCEYKEEYVIPQLLLHCAIKQNCHGKTMGLLYSSTKAIQRRVPIEEYPQHQNLVVPALYVSDKDICSYLAVNFPLTEPEIVPYSYHNKEQLLRIENDMKTKDFQIIDKL